SGLSTTGEIAAVVLFTAVAASSVALPVLAFVTVGDPVLRPLGAAKDWLLRNTAATMAVVVVVLGLLLLKNGIAGL
ncbi:MAG: GAP family protein, partial [Cellulomonadaceae bacterium]|nr:GAP family protein [Cellulomonadaceae bacterium]